LESLSVFERVFYFASMEVEIEMGAAECQKE